MFLNRMFISITFFSLISAVRMSSANHTKQKWVNYRVDDLKYVRLMQDAVSSINKLNTEKNPEK